MLKLLLLFCLTLWLLGSSPIVYASPETRSGVAAPEAQWRPVPDALLAELRGGLRVGRFWVDLALHARDRIDGRLVQRTDLLGPGSRVFDRDGVLFRHELGPRGVVLQVQNARDGLDVRSDVELRIHVRNFEAVLGSPRVRAARSLAGRLQAGAEMVR